MNEWQRCKRMRPPRHVDWEEGAIEHHRNVLGLLWMDVLVVNVHLVSARYIA